MLQEGSCLNTLPPVYGGRGVCSVVQVPVTAMATNIAETESLNFWKGAGGESTRFK